MAEFKTHPTQVFSGTLPISGAFITGSAIRTREWSYASFYITYTPTHVSGCLNIKFANSISGSNSAFFSTLEDGTVTALSGTHRTNVAPTVKVLPTGSQTVQYTIPIGCGDTVQVYLAEGGSPTTTGSALVFCSMK